MNANRLVASIHFFIEIIYLDYLSILGTTNILDPFYIKVITSLASLIILRL